jgi:hypothetical protein
VNSKGTDWPGKKEKSDSAGEANSRDEVAAIQPIIMKQESSLAIADCIERLFAHLFLCWTGPWRR